MRILHTADWHLGKMLEGFSRWEEQKTFLDSLIKICDQEQIDVLLVAGDVYDTSNPPAEAEGLFYSALKALSKGGERLVFIIAGNHDSPERLKAAAPLAKSQGIVIEGYPKVSEINGKVGKYNLSYLGDGVYEAFLKDEVLRVGMLPYPSERRLNEVLSKGRTDEDDQKLYTKRVAKVFEGMDKHFEKRTINLVMSHIFVMGGRSSDSERPIQMGGAFVVNPQDLPKKADYVALGHLHRPQAVSSAPVPTRYAGSPLQYSLSETGYTKSVVIIETEKGSVANISTRALSLLKPIEVWRCKGMEKANILCTKEKERPVWAYLEIETERTLKVSELKALKKIKSDLLSVVPIFENKKEKRRFSQRKGKSFQQLFRDHYVNIKGCLPDKNLEKILNHIINEEVDYETDHVEDQWIKQLYTDANH